MGQSKIEKTAAVSCRTSSYEDGKNGGARDVSKACINARKPLVFDGTGVEVLKLQYLHMTYHSLGEKKTQMWHDVAITYIVTPKKR